jgi:hypothetical protein
MKALSLLLVSGLLSCAAAQAQAGPDWTAYIGTGHASDGRLELHPSLVPISVSSPGPASWTAFIGTGHVSDGTPAFDAKQSFGPSMASARTQPLPWTAYIGTGRAAAVSPLRLKSELRTP